MLTQAEVKKPADWNHLKLTYNQKKLNLYSHPDLEVTQIQKPDRFLVLIGYVIDPFQPELSNEEILNGLISSDNLDDLFVKVEFLSGRFVFLYHNSQGAYLFHDATGLREVFYSFQKDVIYAGSTPDIINAHAQTGMEEDHSLMEFFHSPAYKSSGFWVGNRTPFKNVFHLQPNFYLDLDKKSIHRYWPVQERVETDIDAAVDLMAQLLKGTITGAANRYQLHQGLTAGFESRLLLAASKDVKNKVKYLVNNVNRMSNQADTRIPWQIAGEHQIDFEVVDLSEVVVDEGFRNIFFKNNVYARENHLKVFYDAYQKNYDNTFWVTGTFGNQILRIYTPIKKENITSTDIARLFNYGDYRYAMESIEQWMDEAGELYSRFGYNLVNMFYWEQYTPNMQNLGASEGDIVREEMRPLNCRKLISTYISLQDKYRYKNFPVGYVRIIETLWKELMQIPLAAYTNSPRYWMRKITRFLGLELIIYNMYSKASTTLKYRRA